MVINIISNLSENAKIEDLRFFNNTVAWFLRSALKKKGVKSLLINDSKLRSASLSESEHTIVISAAAMHWIRNMPGYYEKIRKATKGLVTLYLDADMHGFLKGNYFDIVFTVVEPHAKSDKRFVYAGWGADPTYCYSEQKEKAIFVDSLMWGFYQNKFDWIYKIYDSVLQNSTSKIYDPLPRYQKSKRLSWLDMQAIMRKSNYYCCTQVGESGLTRIEAATCGALLVVPEPLYRHRTMGSLEHKIWTTKSELMQILNTDMNTKQIRQKALKHSWDNVAGRILKKLMI